MWCMYCTMWSIIFYNIKLKINNQFWHVIKGSLIWNIQFETKPYELQLKCVREMNIT